MSKPQLTDPTVDYYQRHAEAFAQDTMRVDMQALYLEFLPLVRPGGRILDAGCGTGRDSAYFKNQGFTVTAFDASKELAGIASRTIGERVRTMTFLDVSFLEEFDAVWACASLLHVPDAEMDDAVNRLVRSLKPEGVLYASFKFGRSEIVRHGRFFNDYDEEKLAALISRHARLQPSKVWKTEDARPERKNEWWINALLRKI